MIAEGEDDAGRVPVEVGVEHRARRQPVLEDLALLRLALPVVDDDESGSRIGETAEVLVVLMHVGGVGYAALDGEQAFEGEVGMQEEDATAQCAHGLLDRRAIHARSSGAHLQRGKFGVRTAEPFARDRLRHVVARTTAEIQRVIQPVRTSRTRQ